MIWICCSIDVSSAPVLTRSSMPSSLSARRAPFSMSMKNGLVSVFMTRPMRSLSASLPASAGFAVPLASVVTPGEPLSPQPDKASTASSAGTASMEGTRRSEFKMVSRKAGWG